MILDPCLHMSSDKTPGGPLGAQGTVLCVDISAPLCSAATQISTEIIGYTAIRYIGKDLIMDLGSSAIAGFGAWFGGGAIDASIRWD
jgi:hypothetical protein